jgi:hypothetical protein
MFIRLLLPAFVIFSTSMAFTACTEQKNNVNASQNQKFGSTRGEIDLNDTDAFLKQLPNASDGSKMAKRSMMADGGGNCDINNLPIPSIQFGYPKGLKVIPVTPSRELSPGYSGAIVRVTGIEGTASKSFSATSTLLSEDLKSFSLKDIPFNNGEVYLIQIDYKFGDQTCTYSSYSSDGITWTDLNLKPSTGTVQNCNFSCTEIYPADGVASGSVHNIFWEPTQGQKLKITVGGVIHVYEFDGTNIKSIGKCGGDDPTEVGFEWQYIAHKITHARRLGTNEFQLSIVCSGNCSPIACAS